MNEGKDVMLVMDGSFSGEEAMARGRDVGMAGVGEDGSIQLHHAHPYLVGRTLEAQRDHPYQLL